MLPSSGGGNRKNLELDLAGVPLLWMETEARNAGLRLKPRASGGEWAWQNLKDEMPKKSLERLWWVLEWLPFKRLSYPGLVGTTR
jgi:hypothetical protein